MAINIMLADDHAMVREGLKQLLELDEEIKVISEAGDGEECYHKLQFNAPDVLLLDINMPKMNGLEVLKKMKESGVSVPTIVLTVHSEVEYLLKAVEIGIDGYMLKDSSLDELKKAIKSVASGDTYIQPSMIPLLNNKLDKKEKDRVFIDELTKRELEVLKLIAVGKTNREIADELNISERTVKNHISSIFKKINVLDRTQAAVFAIKNNLVDIYSDTK